MRRRVDPVPRSRSLRKLAVRPAELRAEGVLDLGAASETSVLYVRTADRLYLFHADCMRDRVLDGYAITLAVNWIEDGFTSAEVAGNLGVNKATLQRALSDAGYERVPLSPSERRGHRRMGLRLRLGNRRGQLIRRTASPSRGSDP
jgi:hypothetical protein